MPTRQRPLGLALFASLGPLALIVSGCLGPTCDRSRQDPSRYRAGTTKADGTFYATGSVDEPFLHFPAGRTYRLEHELIALPDQWEAQLAFSPCPFSKQEGDVGERPRCEPIRENEDTGGIANAAGNEVIFEKFAPDFIEIRNSTCAEFYVRVSAWVVPESRLAPPADGGLSQDDSTPDGG